MSELDSLTDALFATADELLGDPFTYTPFGGAPLPLSSLADHEDIRRDFGGSSLISSDAAVEVSKAAVPAWDKRDVIHLPRTGADYHPRDVRTDKSGRYWLMLLKKAAD